ncbi:T9SS type A sorting domain-containing protein [Flavobacterium sp. SM15]|uniref:PKD-like domain-containing protein n=1 Tax=Flavobacterium sp. SM15 TaxID=2908005 RepID=UPI001EDA5EDD|nr:PKD-like domain-containing protein [Flavobacterium sp. SM15]MCG2611133.1 T9SS type A sorting domain-containing protein [Flavobacterium sp. SM15]
MKFFFTLFLLLTISFSFASAKTDDTITCPTATISYPENVYCTSVAESQVMISGTDNFTGGVFSSTSGLVLNSTTGQIYPSQSLPGGYNISYTLSATSECPAFTTSTYIIIESLPTAAISSNPSSVCYGNSATVFFSGTAYSTITYNINGGPNQTITLNQSGFASISTMSLTSNKTYNLVSVSTSLGCTSSISGSKTITVLPVPSMANTPSSPSICSGATVMISMAGSTPNTTFTWTCIQSGVTGASAGSGNMIMQTLSTTGNTGGQVIYNITPTENGCTGTPRQVFVNVFPNPVATLTPPYQEISSGQTTNLSLSSNQNSTNYSWTVSSNNVNGASSGSGNTINQTLTLINPSVSGTVTYFITPRTILNCYGTPIVSDVTVQPNLGVNDFNNLVFTLSPNPVVDYISIKGTTLLNQITVINQLGQQVLEKQVNSKETQLDLSALKNGIYFITLESENKKTAYKIIKQ